MFWIKKTHFKQKNGYLYLRETVYVRDKRTLKRKPKREGDGSATKERGKYSKKKDIYCGKIVEVEPKNLISFREYVENYLNKEYLEFKLESTFDELLYSFVEYLLSIHDITENEFYEGKKQAYFLANGFLCPQTIEWIRRFKLRSNSQNHNELERFAIRCRDSGIYDDEVISALYAKLLPEKEDEEEDESREKVTTKHYKNLKGFLNQNHDSS